MWANVCGMKTYENSSQREVFDAILAKLTIRELSESDVGHEYLDAMNDSELLRFTEARHRSWSKTDVLAYVAEHWTSSNQVLLGIFERFSGRHIGNVRLFNRNRVHRRCELSVLIFGEGARSRGIGSAAIDFAARFAFREWGLHRVMADYYSVNAASGRAFEKAGFRYEGTFLDHFDLGHGEFVDSVRVARLQTQDDDDIKFSGQKSLRSGG